MINQITRIQLIGNLKGYLDVAEAVPVPMTYSVGDIRDISKRTGAFSKSIVLPNTKNNANLLNHYFDINIQAGTFNINKLQQCILLQNNVPITQNAYIQLVNVKKTQNVQTEDDFVEYEVLIKDNVGDFFTKLGGSLLEELDFSTFTHNYTSTNVKASFDNTWTDGYKYVLPYISTPASSGLAKYVLAELKPAIYAKQYWEKIHNAAGFSYTWDTQTASNVRFDKLLIPFNSEDKKISEETLNNVKVIADRGAATYNITQQTGGITVEWDIPLTIPNQIQDNLNIYDPNTSQYTNQFLLNTPTSLAFKFEVDADLVVFNASNVPVKWSGGNYRPRIRVVKGNNTEVFRVNLGPLTNFVSQNSSQNYTILPPGANVIYSINNTFNANGTNLSVNDILKFRVGMFQDSVGGWTNLSGGPVPGFISPSLVVRSIKVTISLDASTVIYGFPINPNSYIPKKIKQSDFIKSICLMYNLFVETDPNDPNKLIYKHRDKFYDTGKLVDWTDKLAREREQNLKFLPELTSKRVILTYKSDKDKFNEVYTNATNQIYGQHEIEFQNEYIKNIETKELIFSPTPVQTTSFGTVGPCYDGQSPNTNIRILLDNGQKSCSNYQIENYTGNVETLNVYPMVSHLDSVTNPTFDINFGVCDFYFYDLLQYTENNLFNNFWARTMAQIDQGKLLTAYFALSAADIQYVKLNDKIRIDNSYWNINKIIDYDAGSNSLTKVELMSIDPALLLPRFGGTTTTFKPDWEISKPFKPVLPVVPVKPVKIANSDLESKRNYSSSTLNSESNILLMGRQNVVTTDFKGIIIGDNIIVKQDGIGIYVGDWLLKDDGTYTYTNLKLIDGGLDITMNKNKTNPVDIIDGGFDSVRKDGGWRSNRVIIDGNDVN